MVPVLVIGVVQLFRHLFARVDASTSARARKRRPAELLPICSSCKKIRDGQNNWHPIEQYLSAHAGIRFTHGICPRCAQRWIEDASAQPPESENED